MLPRGEHTRFNHGCRSRAQRDDDAIHRAYLPKHPLRHPDNATDKDPAVTDTPFPLETTPAQAQAAIKDEFAFFSDWSERYQYLIDLGRKLPDFPDAWKTDAHRLHGCQSMVWIVPEGDADRLDFHAASDSAIVSGLIYLALRVYSGRSAREIVDTDASYIADIGLSKHLSPTRSNGLASLLAFIREAATRALA
jgi:cysteine desulfuration protein SufE